MGLKKDIRKLMNPATGEEEGELPILTHQIAYLRDDFMFGHKKGYLRLAREGLRGTDFEVLMVYFALLDFKNYVRVSQQEIADYLGIPRQNVNRSTRKLIDKKILLEGEKLGNNKSYILNSFFGWKGKIDEKYYEAYSNDSRNFEDDGTA
jgi:hypothetical protein